MYRPPQGDLKQALNILSQALDKTWFMLVCNLLTVCLGPLTSVLVYGWP